MGEAYMAPNFLTGACYNDPHLLDPRPFLGYPVRYGHY